MKLKIYFIYLLNIIQIIVFFLIVIFSLGYIQTHKERYTKMNEVMIPERTLLYDESRDSIDDSDRLLDENEYRKKYKSVKELINKSVEDGDISYIITSNFIKRDFTRRGEDDYYSTEISEDYLKRYPLEIYSGRNFKGEEIDGLRDGEIIPVIVGYDLRDKFEIGEELISPLNHLEEERIENGYVIFEYQTMKTIRKVKKFKIVGIAKPRTMVYVDTHNGFGTSYRDDIIYFPCSDKWGRLYENNKLIKSDEGNRDKVSLFGDNVLPSNTFFESPSKEARERVEKTLNKELKRLDAGKLFNPSTDNYELQTYKENYYSALVLGSIMIFFSTTGLICTLIYMMEERKREFGILMSQGASKSYILIKNLVILIFIILISLLISIIISYFIRNNMINEIKFSGLYDIESSLEETKYIFLINKTLIKKLIFVALSLGIFCSIPLIYKVRKYSIVELIRGKNK